MSVAVKCTRCRSIQLYERKDSVKICRKCGKEQPKRKGK